jgi:hypothetical protein
LIEKDCVVRQDRELRLVFVIGPLGQIRDINFPVLSVRIVTGGIARDLSDKVYEFCDY